MAAAKWNRQPRPTASDYWESASTDVSACGDGSAETSIGCFCDGLYSLAVAKIRRAERQFTCKAKGVFALVKLGTLTNISLSENKTIYLTMTVGSH